MSEWESEWGFSDSKQRENFSFLSFLLNFNLQQRETALLFYLIFSLFYVLLRYEKINQLSFIFVKDEIFSFLFVCIIWKKREIIFFCRRRHSFVCLCLLRSQFLRHMRYKRWIPKKGVQWDKIAFFSVFENNQIYTRCCCFFFLILLH
jgi:hypothetical protein